jgi:hypothetical protein
MDKKSITEVLLDSMHAVKEQLIKTPRRELDAAVLLQYAKCYYDFHNVLLEYDFIGDEYTGLLATMIIWRVNLEDMVSPGKEVLVDTDTVKVIEAINAIEVLVYKTSVILQENVTKLNPVDRRSIMTQWNNAIHILMTTSGGIPS